MSHVSACDVCRDPFPENSPELETMMLRIFTNELPAMVAVTLDLCRKPACREAGIAQLCDQARTLALEVQKNVGTRE